MAAPSVFSLPFMMPVLLSLPESLNNGGRIGAGMT